MELRNAVGSSFGLDPPATLTFDYPTLSALAAYVVEHAPAATAGADEAELDDQADAWAVLPAELAAEAPAGAQLSALVAASCRYPSANGGAASLGDLSPSASVAGSGNADLDGFAAAVRGGGNQPSPVPPQRWDVDRAYHPGERSRVAVTVWQPWLQRAFLTSFVEQRARSSMRTLPRARL